MEEFVVIALLLPGLLFLIAIVVMMLVHRQGDAKAHRDAICDRCGYNLTGNVSGVCPECGLRIRSRV